MAKIPGIIKDSKILNKSSNISPLPNYVENLHGKKLEAITLTGLGGKGVHLSLPKEQHDSRHPVDCQRPQS
jgi:hypothetical protein